VKRTITLEIAGTRFRLVSDADQQHLEALAEMINARVEKFGRSGARTSSSASSSQLLALAALDLADELRSSEQKLAEVERLTRAAIGNAISRIDRGLAVEGKDSGESV
jgi:cell division protein ZapA (FtsZ GTPase activity inhibitor)